MGEMVSYEDKKLTYFPVMIANQTKAKFLKTNFLDKRS